jgi:hypothetical protein
MAAGGHIHGPNCGCALERDQQVLQDSLFSAIDVPKVSYCSLDCMPRFEYSFSLEACLEITLIVAGSFAFSGVLPE